MNTLVAILAAAIPQAFLTIASIIFSEALLQKILRRIIIQGLRYAASLSTNTIDDEIVKDIETSLADKTTTIKV